MRDVAEEKGQTLSRFRFEGNLDNGWLQFEEGEGAKLAEEAEAKVEDGTVVKVEAAVGGQSRRDRRGEREKAEPHPA